MIHLAATLAFQRWLKQAATKWRNQSTRQSENTSFGDYFSMRTNGTFSSGNEATKRKEKSKSWTSTPQTLRSQEKLNQGLNWWGLFWCGGRSYWVAAQWCREHQRWFLPYLTQKNFLQWGVEDIRIFSLSVPAEQVVKAEIFPFCFFLATSPFPPLCVASSRYRPSVIIQGKHSLVFPPSRFLSLNILSLLPDLPPLASSPLPHPCYLLNPISLMLPPPNVLLLPKHIPNKN